MDFYDKKKYKVSTPLIAELFTDDYRDEYVRELKRIGSERVFLAAGFYKKDKGKRAEFMTHLKNSISYLKNHGFEVGVWMWSLIVKDPNNYTRLTQPDGVASDAYICPTDKKFIEFATDYIYEIASCKPDIILFDDDYRYNYGDLGCCCKNHLKMFENKTGISAKPQDIFGLCFTGKPNKYREAWLSVLREPFVNFARQIRSVIDMADPNIRCGFCTSDSSWGLDGFEAIEMSRLLAGTNRPIIRMFGAPYWHKYYGFSLAHTIENERMAAAWCKETDVENMAEGDVYPRPRYEIPASHLECFDTILRADGNVDGILKYTFDYTGSPRYETGYNDAHTQNTALYKEIEEHFSYKECCGVRVFEYPERACNSEFPYTTPDADYIHRYSFDSHVGKVLSACNIPICREGKNPGAVFGENARHIPEEFLDNGLILDVCAAKILTERGFDVGLSEIISEYTPTEETYDSGQRVKIWNGKGIYRISINPSAKVDSYYIAKEDYTFSSKSNEVERCPSAYFYQNSKKQRFFVMAFDSVFCEKSAYRSYCKANQIKKGVEFINNGALHVTVSSPHPDLYMMCKKDECSLSVGLWNLSEDKIVSPTIETDKQYKICRFINCSGKYADKNLTFSTLYPYEFAGVVFEY